MLYISRFNESKLKKGTNVKLKDYREEIKEENNISGDYVINDITEREIILTGTDEEKRYVNIQDFVGTRTEKAEFELEIINELTEEKQEDLLVDVPCPDYKGEYWIMREEIKRLSEENVRLKEALLKIALKL